jgi:hypothetical protein
LDTHEVVVPVQTGRVEVVDRKVIEHVLKAGACTAVNAVEETRPLVLRQAFELVGGYVDMAFSGIQR